MIDRTASMGALPPVGSPALRLVSGRADQHLSDVVGVETGHRAWPLIANYAVTCGRVRIRVTGGATGAFSASLRAAARQSAVTRALVSRCAALHGFVLRGLEPNRKSDPLTAPSVQNSLTNCLLYSVLYKQLII